MSTPDPEHQENEMSTPATPDTTPDASNPLTGFRFGKRLAVFQAWCAAFATCDDCGTYGGKPTRTTAFVCVPCARLFHRPS